MAVKSPWMASDPRASTLAGITFMSMPARIAPPSPIDSMPEPSRVPGNVHGGAKAAKLDPRQPAAGGEHGPQGAAGDADRAEVEREL